MPVTKLAGCLGSGLFVGAGLWATCAYGMARTRSIARCAWWLATSVFSATLTSSREWSKLLTSAISPTAVMAMAISSSNSVKPSSFASLRMRARLVGIEVPHVEAVLEQGLVGVAGLAVPARGDFDRRFHVVGCGRAATHEHRERRAGSAVRHPVDDDLRVRLHAGRGDVVADAARVGGVGRVRGVALVADPSLLARGGRHPGVEDGRTRPGRGRDDVVRLAQLARHAVHPDLGVPDHDRPLGL